VRYLRRARSRLVLEVAAIVIAAVVAAALGAGARGTVAAVAAAWLVTTTLVRRFVPRREAAAEPAKVADEAPSPARLLPEAPPEPARAETLGPQRWNVRDLQRVAGDTGDDELGCLVIYLRDVADADGLLPLDYDPLVRDAFTGATT
jgi:hypothetical protein